MEQLLEKSEKLLRNLKWQESRYLFNNISWNNRLIGIKGARGVGKSTLQLQRLKQLAMPPDKASYWSLDDLFFTTESLVDTVQKFYQQGGRILFLDEVHKYPGWSRHIKNTYDLYDDLQIVFTGSSVIDIAREEADLSRRALMYNLAGMSYREYLLIRYRIELPEIALHDLIHRRTEWYRSLPGDFRPLEFFAEYLKLGYYPFSLEDPENFLTRLQQVIRIVVEYDMVEIKDFDIRNAQKLLQLLYILSANVPYRPNISELARKSGIHRNTISGYLRLLEQGTLIRLLYSGGISISQLQKPEKIFLNNTNLAFALAPEATDRGNLRETFFASQVSVNHKLALPKQGDFLVDDKYTFEIGGRAKGQRQITGVPNSFVVVDGEDFSIEKIPLWMFGMLY